MELKDDYNSIRTYLEELIKKDKLVVSISNDNLKIILKQLETFDNNIRTYKQFLVDTHNTKTYSVWLKNK